MDAKILEEIKDNIHKHANGMGGMKFPDTCGHTLGISYTIPGYGWIAYSDRSRVIRLHVVNVGQYLELAFLLPRKETFLDRRRIMSRGGDLFCGPSACFMCHYGQAAEGCYDIRGCCKACVEGHFLEESHLAEKIFLLWHMGLNKDVTGRIMAIIINA